MLLPTIKSYKQTSGQHHSFNQKYINSYINLKQQGADQRVSLCQEHIRNNLVQECVSQLSTVAEASK